MRKRILRLKMFIVGLGLGLGGWKLGAEGFLRG
jgi:hypothetical protein